MNTSKGLAYVWAGLAGFLNLIQMVAPILPPVWSNLISAVLGVLAFYHIYQSHTPISLGKTGYYKN